MELELCRKCGKKAVYWYMPGYIDNSSPYSCEDCVPRGCECGHRYVNVNAYHPPLSNPDLPTEKDYPIKWIEEGKIWCHVDDKGREYPCGGEYDYNEDGYEKDIVD